MFSQLFHRDVFFPEYVDEGVLELQKYLTTFEFSKHLLERLNSEEKDRSHNYNVDTVKKCLETLKTVQREAFEVELSKDYHYFGKPGWFITKFCVRIPIENSKEILAVSIRPIYDRASKTFKQECKVVTAWINHSQDNHVTLDATKYCNAKSWYSLK